MDAANDVLTFLRDGGAWALVVILGAAVMYLARAYKGARDAETALLRQWNEESRRLIHEQTAASVAQAKTNETVADALDRMAERIER